MLPNYHWYAYSLRTGTQYPYEPHFFWILCLIGFLRRRPQSVEWADNPRKLVDRHMGIAFGGAVAMLQQGATQARH